MQPHAHKHLKHKQCLLGKPTSSDMSSPGGEGTGVSEGLAGAEGIQGGGAWTDGGAPGGGECTCPAAPRDPHAPPPWLLDGAAADLRWSSLCVGAWPIVMGAGQGGW